jgi:hypothetical protein
MALWRMKASGDRVTLTYFESVLRGGTPQNCGESDRALAADVLGWVIDQAAVGDLVETEQGVFVRQAPAFGAKA